MQFITDLPKFIFSTCIFFADDVKMVYWVADGLGYQQLQMNGLTKIADIQQLGFIIRCHVLQIGSMTVEI